MLKSFAKTMVLFAGLVWAVSACAVGFGNATVHSALGQPLKVEIELTDVAPKDEGGMSASLASPDAFKAAGLDYPYSLTTLKFHIFDRDGHVYIAVTSVHPINDSFVNLLVQLDWSAGRLLREYTFLLDPPGYQSAQPQNEVEPIEPMVATAPPAEAPTVTPLQPEGTAAPAPEAAPASAPEAAAPETETPVPMQPESAPAATEVAPSETKVPVPMQPESAPEAAASAPEAAPAESQAETAPPPPVHKPVERKHIKVRRGDTLTKIARRVQEPDLTLDQMLVALYRANAGKFGGRNMNRLRAGTILTMPDLKDYEHLTQRKAVHIVHIQAKNWNAYRQRLAAASAPGVVERSAKQEATGKISTSVEDKTPVAKQSSRDVLKLSAGEKPGDKIVPGGKQAQKNAATENEIAKQKQMHEEQMRISKLQKLNKETKEAIKLQGGVPAPASAAKPAVPATPAIPVHPPIKHKFTPPPPQPPKSMVDTILDTVKGILSSLPIDPLYLGGGLAAILVLGGGAVFWRKRQSGGPAKKKKVKIKPQKT